MAYPNLPSGMNDQKNGEFDLTKKRETLINGKPANASAKRYIPGIIILIVFMLMNSMGSFFSSGMVFFIVFIIIMIVVVSVFLSIVQTANNPESKTPFSNYFSVADDGSIVPKKTISSDGCMVPKSQDLTCETEYGHKHGETMPERYIVHEENNLNERYVILNGVKRTYEETKKL